MIHCEIIIKVNDGLMKKDDLKLFFPNIYKNFESQDLNFHHSPGSIKVDRYLESVFNYSINVDAIEGNEDLFIPRITIHKIDPSQTFTLRYYMAVSMKKAKNISTSMALNHLEDELRLIKMD